MCDVDCENYCVCVFVIECDVCEWLRMVWNDVNCCEGVEFELWD